MKANFVVEKIVGAEQMESEVLILEIWTDGSISPSEALASATKTLNQYFAKLSKSIV